MTAQQHFWDLFFAWSLGLGFLLLLIFIIFIWSSIYEGNFGNPFAPFIRAFEKRQAHKHELERIKLRAQLVNNGIDPEYIKVLERELKDDPHRG